MAQQTPIRLRARTFVPVANVTASQPALEPRGPQPAGANPVAFRHVLIQFAPSITPRALEQLRRAGAVPLRYVPDHTLSVAVPAGFTAAAIEGARWVGGLEPPDRVSGETARDLAAAFASHPLTVVEFHPDVTRARVDQVLAAAGTQSVAAPALPQFAALIPTDALAISRLSEQDAVAWIYPGPDDLGSVPAAICDGLVHPAGIVASFAAMGDGWDGPGRGSARLSYFLSRASADLTRAAQLEEVTRAMAEWSRHVAVTWQPAAADPAAASISMMWGPPDHGDGFPFAPTVLAHAFYPAPPVPEPIAGDVHFNDALLWGIGDARRWDVYSVALHELGHSLGLVHSAEPGAVMYPIYRGIVSSLTPTDVAAIRTVYAPAGPEFLPSGWEGAVVGADSAGQAVEQDGRFVIAAGGRDIWNAADEFRFVSRPFGGSGDIIARVESLAGTHRWSKAGIMLRASLDPGAPHAFALVSVARGLAFQRRPSANGSTRHTDGGAGTAPHWLWLSRRGQRIKAYAAADGGEWRLLGAETIALPHDVLVGLAVTNHDVRGTAAAAFSNVVVSSVSEAPWTATDIGGVGRAGSWSSDGSTVRVRGAGADVWDRADAFNFVWQRVDGDLDIVARLAGIENIKAWSKAGVMIRGGLEPGAPHGFMLGSAGKGFAFQRRRASQSLSVHTAAGGAGLGHVWLKLSRRGDRLSAYRSPDGVRWTMIGSEVIPMAQTVLVGLAVSSHTALATAEAVFDNVALSTPVR